MRRVRGTGRGTLRGEKHVHSRRRDGSSRLLLLGEFRRGLEISGSLSLVSDHWIRNASAFQVSSFGIPLTYQRVAGFLDSRNSR